MYVLRLDDLAREYHTRALVAAVRGQPTPEWDAVKTAFDADLAEPPEDVLADRDHSVKRIKLRALGLAA